MMRITRNFMSAKLFGNNRTMSNRKHMMDRLQSSNVSVNVFNQGLLGNDRISSRTSNTSLIYQNMKNNAGELQSAASKLVYSGDNSVFAKAEKNGNTDEVTEQIQDFVTYYNDMVRSLKNSNSRVDGSYRNMLNSYATMYQSALKETGITKQTDGTLSIDEKTLQEASMEQLQNAWGGNNSFAAKAGTTAAYVRTSAVSNLNSLITNSYSNLLRGYGNSGNFFNFWM